MEFFAQTIKTDMDSNTLKNQLLIKNLPALCASIDKVLSDHQSQGVIYCLWGEFEINREELKQGVRFSMPHCPNALAWTITVENDHLQVHCTINKPTHDEDFISSIKEFVNDWKEGLNRLIKRRDVPKA